MRISRDRMADWSPTDRHGGLKPLIPERDYRGMGQQSDTLRIWLPEPARLGLEQICEQMDTTMTVYLTEYFATYLYGFHELLRMRAGRLGLYAPPEPSPNRRLGQAMTMEPESPNLGKNIFALKLFVPVKLKLDLQATAALAGVTLGEFSRSLICGHLFGREYGPRKFLHWTEEEEHEANVWESEVAS